VKASEAEKLFAESKRLFAEGRLKEALEILTRLDSAHPNDRHLLYPLALCLARLGRVNEAKSVCERLVREFGDAKGAQLLAQLGAPAAPAPAPAVAPAASMAVAAPAGGLGIPGLQAIDLGDLNAPVVKYTPPPEDPAWKKWLIYGGVGLGTVAAVVLVSILAAGLGSQSGDSGGEATGGFVKAVQKFAGMEGMTIENKGKFVLLVVISYLFYPCVLFGVVMTNGRLPYDETWRNIAHIAVASYALIILSRVLKFFLGRLGLIPILLLIGVVKQTYELEKRHVFLWWGGSIIYWFAAGFAIGMNSGVSFEEPVMVSGNEPAPALSVAKWMKGDPVTLEEGRGKNIYVVEFWATWCPPCRQSIPHLTELQKKYKASNVVIIGVTKEDEQTVAPFLAEMGDRMDYHVALDNGEQTQAAFEAIAPIPGIPTAFIIDKEGKVVWSGHPMANLEDMLDLLTRHGAPAPQDV
jgi:thiol-disulfide isomerase/thioredoxin